MSVNTRAELERAVSELAVRSDLEVLAAETAEGAQLLEQLSRALFPTGDADLSRLTWNERKSSANAETAAHNPRAVAEARLRAAEARFRALVEQIPAVTFMAALGEGENEVYVSPHIETLLGFTQQEWLDDPFLWYHQLHPDDRELWNQEFANGCRRGGPFRAECRFLTRDGQVIWVHGEARVIRDELGRPLYLQGIAFDITESKRAQEILLKSSVEQAKFAQQLDIARRVQTSILPTELHAEGLEIAAVMVPAEDVGGDYYDVLPFKGGCYIGVGDVSGHGLDAGLVMMMVQSAVSGLVRANPTATPTRIVCAVNEVIYDNVRNRMHHDDHVTFSLLRYTSDGCVKFAGAHEFILVYRQAYRGIEVIWTRGTWLGAIPDISPATIEQTLRLEPGDVMVLYTDGVTEAMNAEGLQFDLEPLGKAIAAAAPQGPKAVVERVLADIRAFSNVQSDDISIVAARYAGAGQKQESTE